MPRLTRNSEAVKLLRSKFQSGQLTGNETPKRVYESHPIFLRHTLTSFRTCYNRLKKELNAGSGKFFASLLTCHASRFAILKTFLTL